MNTLAVFSEDERSTIESDALEQVLGGVISFSPANFSESKLASFMSPTFLERWGLETRKRIVLLTESAKASLGFHPLNRLHEDFPHSYVTVIFIAATVDATKTCNAIDVGVDIVQQTKTEGWERELAARIRSHQRALAFYPKASWKMLGNLAIIAFLGPMFAEFFANLALDYVRQTEKTHPQGAECRKQ